MEVEVVQEMESLPEARRLAVKEEEDGVRSPLLLFQGRTRGQGALEQRPEVWSDCSSSSRDSARWEWE